MSPEYTRRFLEEQHALSSVHSWVMRLVIVLVLLLVMTLAIGWYNDYASCQRQVPVRKALDLLSVVEERASQNATDVISKQLRHAAADALRVSQVSCASPLPSVK